MVGSLEYNKVIVTLFFNKKFSYLIKERKIQVNYLLDQKLHILFPAFHMRSEAFLGRITGLTKAKCMITHTCTLTHSLTLTHTQAHEDAYNFLW